MLLSGCGLQRTLYDEGTIVLYPKGGASIRLEEMARRLGCDCGVLLLGRNANLYCSEDAISTGQQKCRRKIDILASDECGGSGPSISELVVANWRHCWQDISPVAEFDADD